MTVTSEVIANSPSSADNRSKYVPGVMNVTVVGSEFSGVKTTCAGPLIMDHWTDRLLPGGCPSSATVPFKTAAAGNVIVWLGPAFTTGGWFAGITVILTSSNDCN